MNQLISTDASRIKLIYISWRSTTENPKHSSSSLLSGSVRADDQFLHCSSHLSKPSCQEWIQNYTRAQASLCSEADKLDGSDLLPGAASMLNEQPLGAREQESYLSGVLRGAERWHLYLTPVRELRNVENQHLCLYYQRTLAPSKKKTSLHDAGVINWSVDLLGRLKELWATQKRSVWGDVNDPSNVIQPQSPSQPSAPSTAVWGIAPSLQSSKSWSAPPASLQSTVNILTCLRGYESVFHSL